MSDVNRTYIFSSTSGCTSSGDTDCCNIVNFAIDDIASGSTTNNITFLGYGEESACKILRVHTLSGATYTSFWSNGEEDLDKIWEYRLTYPYF